MKRSLPEQLFRLLIALVGSVILGLGIHLVLLSGIGADPLTMFEEGLSKTLGIDVGTAVLIVNGTCMLLALAVNRSKLGWGTLVTVLAVGPSVTMFEALRLPAPAAFAVGLVVNVLGLMLAGLGIATYMSADYGIGVMESLMTRLAEVIHKPYSITRMSMDCCWLVLGVLLGGTLGVGTVIGVFGLGFFLDFFYRSIQKYILHRG